MKGMASPIFGAAGVEDGFVCTLHIVPSLSPLSTSLWRRRTPPHQRL